MTTTPIDLVARRPLGSAGTAAVALGAGAIALPYLGPASVTLSVLVVVIWFTRSHRPGAPRPRRSPLTLAVASGIAGAVFLFAAPPVLATIRALLLALSLIPLVVVDRAASTRELSLEGSAP
jgi:hypothetical protein